MKRLFIIVTVLFAIILSTSSCSKYEEGPAISLRTKKSRVANEWVVEKAIINGKEVDGSTYDGYIYKLEKDGTGSVTMPVIGTSEIEWEFSDDKEQIRTRSKNVLTGEWEEWKDEDFVTILKLKNDEFWTIDKDNNEEYHYIPK